MHSIYVASTFTCAYLDTIVVYRSNPTILHPCHQHAPKPFTPDVPRPASSSVPWATTLGQAGGLQRSRRVGPMRALERSVGRQTLMQDELFNWCWHGFAWGPPICQPALCEIIVVCPSPSLLVALCIDPLLSLGPLLSSLSVKSSAQACLCASPCHPSRSPVKLARFKQPQLAGPPALQEK